MVFWCGDLNYRLVCHRVLVESAIKGRQLALLQQADQLLQEMRAGTVFEGFTEGPIAFNPTYKFNPGTLDTYDTSAKQRTPSWTDRVLWRVNGPTPAGVVQLHNYTSLPAVLLSDHKCAVDDFLAGYTHGLHRLPRRPVVAEFTVTLKRAEGGPHGSQVFGEVLHPSRWCCWC